MCHQSVGLLARDAEAAGLTTLCLTSALDITQAVNPPRAAFVDYPLGHTVGKPHEPALQRDILRHALQAFTSLTEPGSVKHLPFQWETDNTEWKRQAMLPVDSRLPRHDTPQYQTDDDRQRAEQIDPDGCSVCGGPVAAASE